MSIQNYAAGDIVFAKLKGYPWWPARVENDKDIPTEVLRQKNKSKGSLYTVLFYGTKDYGFFGPECIRPFDKETVKNELKAKKYKSKDLELAIRQALDPSLNEENLKPTKRKGTTIKKEDERREVGKKRLSMEIDLEETKRCKSLENESMMTVDVLRGTPEFKKVYRIRHKLQKLVYEKEAGEIPKEDYAKISAIMNEIERLPITPNLIKYTKIGRVLGYASNYCFDENEFNINQHCSHILKNWKSVIENSHPLNE
ncbi:hypothetical protein G6F43_013208 [Rhizopus delemar]|nr:hypothetical protein G6F43_013208 [Rhizopus delemar]